MYTFTGPMLNCDKVLKLFVIILMNGTQVIIYSIFPVPQCIVRTPLIFAVTLGRCWTRAVVHVACFQKHKILIQLINIPTCQTIFSEIYIFFDNINFKYNLLSIFNVLIYYFVILGLIFLSPFGRIINWFHSCIWGYSAIARSPGFQSPQPYNSCNDGVNIYSN